MAASATSAGVQAPCRDIWHHSRRLRACTALAVFACTFACAFVQVSAQPSTSNLGLFTGPGSESGPSGGGSCGYGDLSSQSWPNGNIASINSNDPLVANLPSNGCGACLQISCADQANCATSTEPVVLIVDSCTECSLTVPSMDFADIEDVSVGNADVIVTQVDCQPTENIVIRILDFRPASGGYLKLVLLNVAGSGAISSLGIRRYQTEDAYQLLTNTYGAVWEADTLPGLPLDLEIIAATGSSVVVPGAISESASGDIPTIVQFPISGLVAPSTTPTAEAPQTSVPVTAPASPLPVTQPLAPVPAASTPPPEQPSPEPITAPVPVPSAEEPTSEPTPVALAPTTPVATAPTQPSAPVATAPTAAAPVATNLPTGGNTAAPAVALGTGPGGCSTVLAVLQSRPELSTWTSVLSDNGDAAALNNVALKLTMFAPNNAAFEKTIGNETVTQLLARQPEVVPPLIGYHIVAGYYASSALTAGSTLTTTDYVQGTDGRQELLTLGIGTGMQIDATGSAAQVITPDLEACSGPSVVHIIDTLLFPFVVPAAAPAAST